MPRNGKLFLHDYNFQRKTNQSLPSFWLLHSRKQYLFLCPVTAGSNLDNPTGAQKFTYTPIHTHQLCFPHGNNKGTRPGCLGSLPITPNVSQVVTWCAFLVLFLLGNLKNYFFHCSCPPDLLTYSHRSSNGLYISMHIHTNGFIFIS